MRNPEDQPDLFSDFADLPLPEEPADDVPPPPEEDLPPEGYEQLISSVSTRDSAVVLPVGRREKRPATPLNTGGSELLAGLNPQQEEAVKHRGSPLLIVAGAGSGKTSVLTRRIAYLLQQGVAPWEILAITFTNKAAAEMRERVMDLVGPQAERMWVSTFHSTCVRILRANAHLAEGLNSNFTIYDSDDSKRLITLVIKDHDLDIKEFSPRGTLSVISNWKNELVGPDEAMQDAKTSHNVHREKIAALYRDYQQRLRGANAVDFDDIIGEVVAILRRSPEVTEHYRRRFRHVMVDEYQDTNHAQYELVSALVGKGPNMAELCVVGDADQSIYAFRGATIRNIEEFERDYPEARTILLEQNYRSTQTILTAANAVIDRNQGRHPKKLWTDLGDGELIGGYVADNEHDEARFIAEQIDDLVDNDGFRHRDIAIMYRTNNASRALEDVLVRSGLPYKVVGGTRFYERKEIRDVVAYLKVLDNPDDTVALRRIINTPRRGIGDRALAQVSVHAENLEIPWAKALEDAAEGKVAQLSARGKNAIAGFLELLANLRKEMSTAVMTTSDGNSLELPDVGKIVNAVLDMSGYREILEKSNDPQDGTRLDNLNEMVAVGHEFSQESANLKAYQDMPGGDAESEQQEIDALLSEGEAPLGSLQAFLERVSLVADADQVPAESQDMITLMTLHTAKGLEFPVVFLAGWEDGQFPHMRALSDPVELSEERRLAYVGITRAKQRLFICRAVTRSGWGQAVNNPPSRFLSEVPEELWEWIREEPTFAGSGSFGGSGSYGSSGGFGSSGTYGGSGSYGSGYGSGGGYDSTPMFRNGGRPAKKPAASAQSSGSTGRGGKPLDLAVGDRVNHDKYGLGTVKSVDRVGTHATAMIDFGGSGTVRLMLVGGLPMEKL
ncbi:UvrD-helicase domain-containing protein [Corynebacterium suicordis]|uniref:DNA 3'-5' helicase n=1 Tax=Corynebacterium suicordis DSM 45110 TaxID=1121369 RepID=A0ABR9ZHZ9_9CORY|nr:UvrD-helicase domain-containing protein [Corynebacterium suicordis]MBF4553071.1 UvrD-helicase domain-containing protein [Corynebacterium suicordis DSM 45110]MDR6277966.1 DNA helicase-2/ATP-dependent DNA helicase PcrA [Corynebacterium suicordis]